MLVNADHVSAVAEAAYALVEQAASGSTVTRRLHASALIPVANLVAVFKAISQVTKTLCSAQSGTVLG